MSKLRVMTRLVRWLGPWADGSRPVRVRRRSVSVAAPEPFDAWVYHPPREPDGALFVVPGLHYLGPADPRFDRFLAILADSGLLVFSPFLPETRRLGVGPAVVAQARAAHDAFLALPDLPPVRPGIFSVSFGSYPAIALAAERAVPQLVLFGGFASFSEAIRFSMADHPGQPRDPLNRPVVFLNLYDHIEGLPRDGSRLRAAWTEYVRCTWGKPPMKDRARWEPLARSIAARLPADEREPFLIGTGALEGAPDLIDRALERAHADLVHLDPFAACAKIRGEVSLVHGREDDVIPHTHAEQLAAAMTSSPRVRLLVTGLFAHSGHGVLDLGALADEGRKMFGILDAIAASGTTPR